MLLAQNSKIYCKRLKNFDGEVVECHFRSCRGNGKGSKDWEMGSTRFERTKDGHLQMRHLLEDNAVFVIRSKGSSVFAQFFEDTAKSAT